MSQMRPLLYPVHRSRPHNREKEVAANTMGGLGMMRQATLRLSVSRLEGVTVKVDDDETGA